MTKKTKINISSKKRSKSYIFSENFIFQIKILAIFVVWFFVLLIFAIFNLSSKNSQLIEINKTLFAKNNSLAQENNTLLLKAIKIDKELNLYNEKVQDLEISAALDSVNNELKEQKKESISVESGIKKSILINIPNGYPLEKTKINDYFGFRIHPISNDERMHYGVDLKANMQTPIYATASGFVEYAANSNTGYGYLVILSHNYGFKTRYAHLYSIDVVHVGQWVKKGELIGYSGNTGLSTGPHLHYEVRFLERAVDPLNFLKWGADEFNNIFTQERKIPWQALATAISEN